MRVVKLGGSLLQTGKIFDCLKQILKQNEKTVVVCGGGEFANSVRIAQKKYCFDDIAAHEMAILAMKQTAILCQNLQPEFEIASSISEMTKKHLTIWSPDINELNADNINASWGITSDSLSAWLATKIHAEKLILIKSCDVDSTLTISELTKRFIVDAKFSHFVKNVEFDLKIMSATRFLSS